MFNKLIHISSCKKLKIFLFHSLFENVYEKGLNLIDPSLGTTLSDFKNFIDFHLSKKYVFTTFDNISNLLPNQKYAIITFDDGYSNNKKLLPILMEYSIPAVLFISTNYVKSNKCFWWDIIYRNRTKEGRRNDEIFQELQYLKKRFYKDIERYITQLYGEEAFTPVCHIDRPLTPYELSVISKESLIKIGNHTSDHENLKICSTTEIHNQIINAQNYIYDITQKIPSIISYPYGFYSNKILSIAHNLGISYGVIVKSNNISIIPYKKNMQMSRYIISNYQNW